MMVGHELEHVEWHGRRIADSQQRGNRTHSVYERPGVMATAFVPFLTEPVWSWWIATAGMSEMPATPAYTWGLAGMWLKLASSLRWNIFMQTCLWCWTPVIKESDFALPIA